MGNQIQNPENARYSRHADLTLAFNIFGEGMREFVEDEMTLHLESEEWFGEAAAKLGRSAQHDASDPYFQLLVLKRFWGPVFSKRYSEDLRPVVDELVEIRNLWAHFSIPDDVDKLDRAVIIMERLLAPINADAAVAVRSVRYRLKHPRTGETPEPTEEEKLALRNKLDLAREKVENISQHNSQLSTQLAHTRRISAGKQLKLSGLENQLVDIQSKADALEDHLREQRKRHDRIEWLFAAFLLCFLLAVLITSGLG